MIDTYALAFVSALVGGLIVAVPAALILLSWLDRPRMMPVVTLRVEPLEPDDSGFEEEDEADEAEEWSGVQVWAKNGEAP
jgi:hypothetical protein